MLTVDAVTTEYETSGMGIETSRLLVMLSVRVYLYVCVIDMGMDMHTCIMSAHT